MRDITERKKAADQQLLLEEQLRQAQKMESIGRLAGGVAHDFNNQLAVIKLYGDLMRYRMSKDDPLLPKLEQIRQAVDRATHLTRQLLAFSRKQMLQPVVLDMNELVTNLERCWRVSSVRTSRFPPICSRACGPLRPIRGSWSRSS